MGLTTRELQSQLTKREPPHYYVVTLSNGQKRHCGTPKDVECVLSIYPGSYYTKVIPPTPPDTVDVPYIRIKDQELPMQQILPQSTAQELKL